jgi:hypothetical protein
MIIIDLLVHPKAGVGACGGYGHGVGALALQRINVLGMLVSVGIRWRRWTRHGDVGGNVAMRTSGMRRREEVTLRNVVVVFVRSCTLRLGDVWRAHPVCDHHHESLGVACY